MSPSETPLDPYPSRQAATAHWISRREPVLHGGPNAPGPLSAIELAAYDRDGFLVLPGVFNTDEAAHLRREVDTACDLADPNAATIVREPDSDTVRSLFAIHEGAGPLARLAGDPRLVERARQILGDAVGIHQSRVNRKPGLIGREFGWHSDFETWHTEDGMPAMQALSMSVMLSDNHTCNGPTLLIPGSHRTFVTCPGETPADHHLQSLRRQEYGVPDHESIRRLVAMGSSPRHPLGIAEATGPAGSLLIFDCNLLHGSPGNLTPHARVNVFIVYSALSNVLGQPLAGTVPRPAYLAARPARPPWSPPPVTPHPT